MPSSWASWRVSPICAAFADAYAWIPVRLTPSPALAIRFTLLMTLVPDADYTAVIETLLGDLVLVPWQRPYRVPTAAVACIWREALGPVPLERLRDHARDGIVKRGLVVEGGLPEAYEKLVVVVPTSLVESLTDGIGRIRFPSRRRSARGAGFAGAPLVLQFFSG